MAPTNDDGNGKDGRVFDPDELDITEHDEVTELGEGRFLVSSDATDGPSEASTSDPPTFDFDEPPEPAPESDEGDGDEDGEGDESVDARAVGEWLAQSMKGNGFDYGFDATMKIEGTVNRHRMVSNDVVTTFETLMLWYARQVGGETPVEETLGILLEESTVPIQYPQRSLEGLLSRYELSSDDDIAALVSAVDDDGGLSLSTR